MTIRNLDREPLRLTGRRRQLHDLPRPDVAGPRRRAGPGHRAGRRAPLDHLRAAVLLSPPGDLHGLTPRDLRALGQPAGGAATTPAIATALDVDERTVADAIRVTALDAPNLTAATVLALRIGLRIPPRLATPT
jgi:hypothetical protein